MKQCQHRCRSAIEHTGHKHGDTASAVFTDWVCPAACSIAVDLKPQRFSARGCRAERRGRGCTPKQHTPDIPLYSSLLHGPASTVRRPAQVLGAAAHLQRARQHRDHRLAHHTQLRAVASPPSSPAPYPAPLLAAQHHLGAHACRSRMLKCCSTSWHWGSQQRMSKLCM